MIRIEHIALWTKDIERLRQFYQQYFNATGNQTYHNDSKQFTSCFLSFAGSARLELMHHPDLIESCALHQQKNSGYAHIAISLGSVAAVNGLTQRMHNDGIKVLDGPRRTGDGYYESTVLDPDGNIIELTV